MTTNVSPGAEDTGANSQIATEKGSQGTNPEASSPSLRDVEPGAVQLVQEPSAWLRAAGARAVRRLHSLYGQAFRSVRRVVIPIGDWSVSADHGTAEDRTCDRCRVYVSEGEEFHVGHYRANQQVFVVFGLCSSCQRAEVGA